MNKPNNEENKDKNEEKKDDKYIEESEKIIPSEESSDKSDNEALEQIKRNIKEKKRLYEDWRKLDIEINLYIKLGDFPKAELYFNVIKESPMFKYSEERLGNRFENEMKEMKLVYESRGEKGLIEWVKIKRKLFVNDLSKIIQWYDENEEKRNNLKLRENQYYKDIEGPFKDPNLN